jgi:hypothetical protein
MSQDVVQDLKVALDAVSGASVPDELRPVAFVSAFWALRDGRAGGTAGAHTDAPIEQRAETLRTPANTGGGALERLGQKLGLSNDEITFVYEFDEDLTLCVPPSRLAPVLRVAVEQIIYLVAAGRQGGGLEPKTSAQLIKDVCTERGRSDSNFSRTLKDLHGKGLVVGGSGRGKTVTVNAAGFERAGAIIKEIKDSVG